MKASERAPRRRQITNYLGMDFGAFTGRSSRRDCGEIRVRLDVAHYDFPAFYRHAPDGAVQTKIAAIEDSFAA
jgi:hypothetical protein